MLSRESARQAAESAQGWTEIHNVWQYVSTDYRWVIVFCALSITGTVMGWKRSPRAR